MHQDGVILVGGSGVERQVDEIERLGEVESTNEEEKLQNEETEYERFALIETLRNIRWSARGLACVSAAWGEHRVGRKGKGRGGNAGPS